MKPYHLLPLLLCACKPTPKPADPRLLAELERTLVPNSTVPVSDGDLVSGLYFVVDSGYGYPHGHPLQRIYVDPTPIVTVGNFTDVRADESMNGQPEVRFLLDSIGAARWQVATRKVAGKPIAIVVNDSVVSAPVVLEEIANGRASFVPGGSSAISPTEYVRMLRNEQQQVAPVR